MDYEIFADLVEHAGVPIAQIRAAAEEARAEGTAITEVLVARGIASKAAVGAALGRAHGCRFVAFDLAFAAADLPEGASTAFLERRGCVAIRDHDGRTLVVTDDPRDRARREAVDALLGDREPQWCVALASDVARFVAYIHHGSYADTAIDPFLEQALARADSGAPGGEDRTVSRLADQILRSALDHGASDIHLEPYTDRRPLHIRFRVDGSCLVFDTVPHELEQRLIARFKIMAGLDVAERRLPQDGKMRFRADDREVELRVAVVPTRGGVEDVVLRILPSMRPLPLADLGFSTTDAARVERMTDLPYGMILVAGPSGSGKTTTLHAALSRINRADLKIWTIEDPVEITQFGLRQVQVANKAGLTFPTALRSLLRADPDVIMIGEMRDTETVAIGVQASLTGHLVLSTLHANTAPETIVRMLDLGVEPYAFADALVGVVAQRLARKLCEKCKEGFTLSEDDYDHLREEYGVEAFEALGVGREDARLYRARGCEACLRTGYRGRSGLYEVMEMNDDLRRMVQQKRPVSDVREQARREGMTTLKQDGIRKALLGVTDLAEVRRTCIR